jgi:hypothetical protein
MAVECPIYLKPQLQDAARVSTKQGALEEEKRTKARACVFGKSSQKKHRLKKKISTGLAILRESGKRHARVKKFPPPPPPLDIMGVNPTSFPLKHSPPSPEIRSL